MTAPRYGIGEWYGERLTALSPRRRQQLAEPALDRRLPQPPCPFRSGRPPCSKKGGVCTLQRYEIAGRRIEGSAESTSVVVCPHRFDENHVVYRWLADIVGFQELFVAREVPFMRAPVTGREAGRIDLVVASDAEASDWFALEIQAVYFSGERMETDFLALLVDEEEKPPQPNAVRRPDWRSSSAKRLMPQLEVKTPTLRRWGKKLAVAVDLPFFEAMGGPSESPSRDLNAGDVLWLVPKVSGGELLRHHWEVLSLEDSARRLLAATPVSRSEFERGLRRKLGLL